MPTPLASLDSLVHPHQMEVQEFGSYAFVIDARSAEAYQEDHIPGAVSVPVSALHASPPGSNAAAGVARHAQPSVAWALAVHLQRLAPGDAVLVYCDRGGLDSRVWARPLEAAGFRVDVLGGGWGNYRRWVDAGLEVLPRALTFVHLGAPPVGGLCRVLDRLLAVGEQVLDLTALAGQRLVPGLTLAGDEPPTQAAFDTALLDALRRFDPRRPVWVRDGLNGLGELALAPSMRDALLRSNGLWLEVPLTVRADAWSERLQAMGTNMAALLQAVSGSAMPPAPTVVEQWRSRADAGQVIDALAKIIKVYVDRHDQAARRIGHRPHVVRLASLTVDAVASAVERWRDTGAWSAPGGGGHR